MFCSRLFSWYRIHCIHHHILGVNILSIFSSPSPSFRPRAGDLVTMMLTINRRHPTCKSVQWVCATEAEAAADGWCKCLSYHQLWLALSGSECWVHPNHFPGALRRSGSCVFVFVCNLSWLMCDCVFSTSHFFGCRHFLFDHIKSRSALLNTNHSRASGRLVLETGVQPCNPSFKHRKLLPNLKCNSWPLDKGWLNASSLPCNKQTAPSNNSVMKIKRVPKGGERKCRGSDSSHPLTVLHTY